MRTHGAVVGRRFRSVTKLTTKVRLGRGYLWGGVLIAAAALNTPTRNGYNAQGVNLKFRRNRPRGGYMDIELALDGTHLTRRALSPNMEACIIYTSPSLSIYIYIIYIHDFSRAMRTVARLSGKHPNQSCVTIRLVVTNRYRGGIPLGLGTGGRRGQG